MKAVIQFDEETKRFFIYDWTTSMARRKDCTPISDEEFEFYMMLTGEGVNTIPDHPKKFRDENGMFSLGLYMTKKGPTPVDVMPVIDIAPEIKSVPNDEERIKFQEENPVLDNAKKLTEMGGKPLCWTQEQLLEIELEKIRVIMKKPDLEAYMLENHRIPLTPATMVKMKDEARLALHELAKRNELHISNIS